MAGEDEARARSEADQFVVATGAWTPLLNKHSAAACRSSRARAIRSRCRGRRSARRIPLIFEEHRVAITPFATRLPHRLDDGVRRLRRHAEPLAARACSDRRREAVPPRAGGEPVQEEWWGWRPMVYDGKPIIDRSPALENVLIAAGHGMLGLSMADRDGQAGRGIAVRREATRRPGALLVEEVLAR